MKTGGTKPTQPKGRRFGNKSPANYTRAAQQAKVYRNKKSPYAPLKQTTEAKNTKNSNKQPVNNENNSSNQTKNVAATGQSTSIKTQKNDSIFLSSPLKYNEISADVVRADCMNHGYRIERTVGEGAYAKVKLAEVLPSKLARNPIMAEIAQENDGTLQVAIKIIDNKHVPKEFLKKFLPRELSNHCPLPPHNHVVRVFEQFKTTDRFYVVMEYCSKGDLLDLINQRISESCKGLGEDRARRLFRMMAEGVHHIHHNGIVHRDLKCENILLDRHDNIKITDFGFSTRFEHGKSALLKTSCGSYAYTAPEVIKMKSYDGTKSDTWSLGIILFAMLNGRLPFNDAQLSDLEEDMKMQRLRFERNVSFESMVLVRRILQFSPESRPSTSDILSDPWLTGKRLIPRQPTKPKWINPYQARKDEGDTTGPSVVGTNNPVYYKGTLPERGPEATITVNHEKNETVVLKSRTGNKKNIWTSGPPVSHRPNTWPRSEKDKVKGDPKSTTTKRSAGSRGTSGGSRATSGTRKNTNTTVIVRPPTMNSPTKKGQTGKGDTKARVSSKTIKLSKWFMEKYMNGKECHQDREGGHPDCKCCKAEAAAAVTIPCKYEVDDCNDIEEELQFLDIDIPEEPELEEFRFPSPVKNQTETKPDSPIHLREKSATKSDTKSEKSIDMGPPASPTRQEFRACASAGPPSVCSRRVSDEGTRKPGVKSAYVRTSTIKKESPKEPVPVKAAPDTIKKCLVNYMVNRSTSPAERVKYFRDRLMKLYGNDKVQQDSTNGLPPLMVQALKPQSPSPKPTSPEPASPPQTPYKRQVGAKTWRARRGKSGTTPKPVQRVVVHSAML